MMSTWTTDTWGWSVDFTVGANTRTYTNSATTAGSAYKAIEAMVSWLNDGARPWTGTRTWSWSWNRYDDSGAQLHLTCDNSFTMTAGASSTLYFFGGVGVTAVHGTDGAVGTWAPKSKVWLSGNYRLISEQGDACAAGAVRPDVPGKAGKQPRLSAVADQIDAARLTHILGHMANPRRATVYQQHSASWVDLALGQVNRTDAGYLLWRVTAEVGGASV